MLGNIKHTATHTLIYSIGNLSTKLIGLLLLPIYVSKLTTADYGVLAYLETTSIFLFYVISFGLPSGILRFCTSDKKEYDKEIIFTIFTFAFLLTLIVLIPLFIFRLQVSELLLDSKEFKFLITLMLLTIPLEVFNSLTLSVIRVRERSGVYVYLVLTKLTLSLVLNIYFIVHKHMKVDGILLSQLISNGVILLLSAYFLSKNMILRFRKDLLREILPYSFPLIFSTISSMLLAMSDRYLIEYFLDFSQLGIYSLGVKFAGIINVFVLQSFQLGYLPLAFKIYKQPDAKKFFTKITTYLVLVLIVTSLVVSLFSKELIILIARKNTDYWGAIALIPLLCLGYVFKGMQYLFSLSLHYVKKTYINAFVVMFSALLNIGINILVLKYWGIMGATVSTMFCYWVMAAFYYFFSQKYYPMRYEWGRILLLFTSGIGIYMLSYYVLFELSFINFTIKICMLLFYPFLLYFLGFYHRVEVERMQQFWNKWRRLSNLRENLNSMKKPADPISQEFE